LNCAHCGARWQFFSVNVASKLTGWIARAASDGAAALLAFGARAAAITAAAFAAEASATATPPPATAAEVAVTGRALLATAGRGSFSGWAATEEAL
jgi:hypothetical protein